MINQTSFKVLLIEDDPMVQEVNKQFIEKINGFHVVGVASNGKEGLMLLEKHNPELVLLDVYMPKQNGLETMKLIRSKDYPVDIIAITAANDFETIQQFIQNGAVDYIVKPFKFERIKKALNNYKERKLQLNSKTTFSQQELDQLLHFNNTTVPEIDIPKGLNAVTLNKVLQFMTTQSEPVSAEEVADGVGIARVTARRYLEHLEREGKIKIKIQYGGVGRPVNRYHM